MTHPPPDASADEPTHASIQVIERVAVVLDVLASHNEALSLKTLSALTSLHPSTAHRILNDLVQKRLVDRSASGNYRLGIYLLELGNIVRSRMDVREAALQPMRRLHHRTEQTVNLSLRQADEIVYIERAFAERSGMQVVRAIGDRAPLHLTSTGKLFLSQENPAAVAAYAARTGLPGHNQNSLTSLDALLQDLNEVRRHGFSRDNEELELGVRCIAAGIFDDNAQLIAGLSISAPANRMHDDWIDWLQTVAREISAALGYRE